MKRIYHSLALVATMLVFSSLLFPQSNYFQFGELNQNSVDLDSHWKELQTGTHTFTKSSDTTTIEVQVNSRFGAARIDANGVPFQVRIDGIVPTFENQGSLGAIDLSYFSHLARSYFSEFLSIFAVFQNLPAGTHKVSIWAQAPRGSASGVIVDPGGWGGRIIIKEAL